MHIEDIEIGDTITVEMGLELCEHFDLGYLVERLTKYPERYKSFKFDGCSGIPDQSLCLLGCRWQDITYQCCLQHDLGYAYGMPGNMAEKKMVDSFFYNNLVDMAGVKPWIAKIFKKAVELGGQEWGLSFSWAFSNKKER